MSRPVRVLAGILHVGETSLPRTLASLEGQVGVDVDLHLIGHQPKWEAHRQLYERFTEDAGSHDVLMKVDADMELAHPGLSRAIGEMFRRFHHIDQVIVGVDDWFTGERILGMGAWRSGVRWTAPPLDLFTDHVTSTRRAKFKLIDAGFPLVLHGSDPTVAQSLRFGAHRALKAAASPRSSRLDRLETFADHAVEHPEEGRLLALGAAVRSLEDEAFGRRCVDGTAPVTEDDVADLRRRIEQPAALRVALLERTARIRAHADDTPDAALAFRADAPDQDGAVGASKAGRATGGRAPGPGLRGRIAARLRPRRADRAEMTRAFLGLLESTGR